MSGKQKKVTYKELMERNDFLLSRTVFSLGSSTLLGIAPILNPFIRATQTQKL